MADRAPADSRPLARVLLRTIDDVDYFVAVRDTADGPSHIGTWDYLALAHESILAAFWEATGDPPYGAGAESRIKQHPQTPLPS